VPVVMASVARVMAAAAPIGEDAPPAAPGESSALVTAPLGSSTPGDSVGCPVLVLVEVSRMLAVSSRSCSFPSPMAMVAMMLSSVGEPAGRSSVPSL
jgi:hypothetical protein